MTREQNRMPSVGVELYNIVLQLLGRKLPPRKLSPEFRQMGGTFPWREVDPVDTEGVRDDWPWGGKSMTLDEAVETAHMELDAVELQLQQQSRNNHHKQRRKQ